MHTEERTDIAVVAVEEARDAMANLGIKGSTANGKVVVKALVKFKLPNVKVYFANAKRIHDKEVELMEKYPDVTFDFDIEFTGK